MTRSNPGPTPVAQGAVASGRGLTAASGPQRLVIPPESEAHFQAAVVKLARTLGWRVYHTYDSRRSEPGFPDLVLVKHPRIIFLECKRQGGRATKAQKEWIGVLGGCQTHAFFVWPTSVTFLASILQDKP